MKKSVIVTAILSVVAIIAVCLLANMDTLQRRWGRITRAKNAEASKQIEEVSEEDFSAFLRDETFFDPEDRLSGLLASHGQNLDLLVNSVEKDLRIKVVNTIGVPVAGQDFVVDVNDTPYTDDNRDGMIYIPNMEPGEYYISLEPMEGFQIPNSKIKVMVKNQVEYQVIDDISYLIKTEDEINAEAEDSGINAALSEADSSERSDAVFSGESTFGIDVSKWNKEIDWKKVKEAGVSYAIIRCGYRGSVTGSLVEDPYFAANIQGATEAGVKVGLYFFTQATTRVEAVEEASAAIMLADRYRIQYPIFIDTEGAGGAGRADGIDKNTRTEVCGAFCQTIENAGFTAGVYASKNWFLNNLDVKQLEKYVMWLAEYKSEPTYEGNYQIWQYSSKGQIEGIDGRVDLNLSLLNIQ